MGQSIKVDTHNWSGINFIHFIGLATFCSYFFVTSGDHQVLLSAPTTPIKILRQFTGNKRR